MKKKISELNKKIIGREILSLKSMTDDFARKYIALSKANGKRFKEMVSTFNGAIKQISAGIDKAMGL